MGKESDFDWLKRAIQDYDREASNANREKLANWRHHCFTNYPVGEVLTVIRETEQQIADIVRRRNPSKFPRRWTEGQHC